ncbi:reductase [Paractinoplanes rishiriensis]|uniref:Reductase n=1 Tax=Paractinoplanes rishiriensis TaxID=1050105 RepID=A0A919K3B9_9ACTN|nr:reductase [Actinoplanes rishiriensis]
MILGGTEFVGRATAVEAVRRGAEVTVFNRGRHPAPAGVTSVTGDRLTLESLPGTWDAVVDTWSGAAEAVERTARLLKGRAGHYGYVSTRSVFRLDDPTRLVDAEEAGYAGDKLRGELATEEFGGPVLLARAGLILGPHENIGRLPWWLNRLARGGPTLAPGPRDLPLQYVDARDLANFLLDSAAAGTTGPFNVISESGHTTMGELLETAAEVTGGRAELRWTDPETIAAAGIEPWTDLPIWLPPGELHDFLHGGDVTDTLAAGLRCRPVRETIADTWAWLQSLPGEAPQRPDRPAVGLDPAVEAKVLGE